MNETESFEHEPTDHSADEPALVVDVEGFEGPLDLLLALARQQKVDLAKISVLALAEQYLASSRRRGSCGPHSPPPISGWRRGPPISNRGCCCRSPPHRTAPRPRTWPMRWP